MTENQKVNDRPDPDILLKKINKTSRKRGMLTVFLGAMAGVGKTFTMLKVAHEKLKEGRNIVIGWVDTHGRSGTDEMVIGLPMIAPIEICHHDKMLKEMDIDAILKQKPEIVIVDELAHSNVPGSRHKRRYQDVEELLEAGIHVYTAVNIQHIESLNDIVAQITGVIVKETIPDSVLKTADTVQFIDIAPEELMQRLKDGKIYLPMQAEQALKSFFRQGNISALRELALRFMAQHVDKDLEEYMREHNIAGPWQASGKVMVGVSGSPFSAQLIRAAARLAAGLRSEILAVHIETAESQFPIGDKERDRIAKNMRLAEDLGAKTLTVVGENFIQEFLEVARNQNVTAIVIGKSKHSNFIEKFRGGSIVDKIIRHSGDINVYIIQGNKESENVVSVRKKNKQHQPPLVAYFYSLMMVAITTFCAYYISDYLEIFDTALIYIIPVLLSAIWWGRWPSYLTALVGVLFFDLLFIEPLFTLKVTDLRYVWSFFIFLIISFLIGGRTEKLRTEMRQARQQEKSTRAVYQFSREIVAISDMNAISHSLAKYSGETIERKTIIALPDEKGGLNNIIKFDSFIELSKQLSAKDIKEAEVAVMAWVYKNNHEAGRSTETLPGGKYLYIPISIKEKVYGVFGICLAEKKLTPSERRMVDAWVRLAAIAMERASLTQQAYKANLLIEADKLRGALFNSISHELKTPLSAILGSVSTLLEADTLYSKEDRRELLANIKDSSLRMERLITNLLDTARLESGMIQLKYDWCDIEDLIGTTIRHSGESLNKNIQVDLPDNLPLIRADFVLLEQVLINLIDNAIKYSNNQVEITIRVRRKVDEIEISIMDRGEGIPEENLNKVFDKFYRVKKLKKISGTGLGLSICKGIVEAHKGRIYAENRTGGGAVISFVLPIEEPGKIEI